MRKPWILAFVLAALLLAGCGDTDPTKAKLRLVNASGGYAQLDLRIQNEVAQGGVGYGGSAGYAEVDPDDKDTTVTNAGSPTPLLSLTTQLSKKRYYTLLAFGEAGALRQVLMDDNVGEPDNNKTLLRVINAAANAGSLDVYLTGTTELLENSTPVQGGAVYAAAGSLLTVNSGTWRLRVTAAGSKTDVRLDLSVLDLPSRGIRTLVLTPGAGGVLVNALVLAQQGGIARADATQARVRLASAMAGGATAGASVGGVSLASAAPAATLTAYTLLPAGTAALNVFINGQAAATSSITLDPGRDYTLMVHGATSPPSVTLISDDNRLPTDTTRAKLRLLNGLAGGGTMSMTLDGLQVADGVAVGSAGGIGGGYTSVSPTTGTGDGVLSVVAGSGGSEVLRLNNQRLEASGVHTVLVLDLPASGSARGFMRRDR